MSQSGVSVNPDCITKFNELKLGKQIKWIIYKLSDDQREIVVEEASSTADYEDFRKKLLDAKSKTKSGAESIGPRYAVYDFEYSTEEGSRSKVTFIAWSPDSASIQPKMTYASSKDSIRRALNGIQAEIQANDADDIEYDSLLKIVSKGQASK